MDERLPICRTSRCLERMPNQMNEAGLGEAVEEQPVGHLDQRMVAFDVRSMAFKELRDPPRFRRPDRANTLQLAGAGMKDRCAEQGRVV